MPVKFVSRRGRFMAVDDLPEPEEVYEEDDDNEPEPELSEVDETSSNDDLDRIEEKYKKRAKSPLKAIRAFCVICMGCQPRQVAFCTAPNCVLYPFRFGRNPFQSRKK